MRLTSPDSYMALICVKEGVKLQRDPENCLNYTASFSELLPVSALD